MVKARFAGVELDPTMGTISYGIDRMRSLSGAQAWVETAGQIDRRVTATRLVLAGPMALALQKKKDSREMFLMVQGEDFAWVVELDPDRYKRAMRFANEINNAARQGGLAGSGYSSDEDDGGVFAGLCFYKLEGLDGHLEVSGFHDDLTVKISRGFFRRRKISHPVSYFDSASVSKGFDSAQPERFRIVLRPAGLDADVALEEYTVQFDNQWSYELEFAAAIMCAVNASGRPEPDQVKRTLRELRGDDPENNGPPGVADRTVAHDDPDFDPDPRRNDSRVQELKDLAELHRQGYLTDEEFAAEKRRLLSDP